MLGLVSIGFRWAGEYCCDSRSGSDSAKMLSISAIGWLIAWWVCDPREQQPVLVTVNSRSLLYSLSSTAVGAGLWAHSSISVLGNISSPSEEEWSDVSGSSCDMGAFTCGWVISSLSWGSTEFVLEATSFCRCTQQLPKPFFEGVACVSDTRNNVRTSSSKLAAVALKEFHYVPGSIPWFFEVAGTSSSGASSWSFSSGASKLASGSTRSSTDTSGSSLEVLNCLQGVLHFGAGAQKHWESMQNNNQSSSWKLGKGNSYLSWPSSSWQRFWSRNMCLYVDMMREVVQVSWLWAWIYPSAGILLIDVLEYTADMPISRHTCLLACSCEDAVYSGRWSDILQSILLWKDV